MAKTSTVKCPRCQKENLKENAIKYKNRYYCPQCLEAKKSEEDKNTNGWDNLYGYMQELYGNVSIKIITQIARYRKEPYNFTNEGMRLTLYYYHELLENPHNEEAIGLIPYYYEKAKEEYIINRDIRQHNANIEVKNNIKRIQVKPTKKIKTQEKKLIDLNTLRVGGHE